MAEKELTDVDEVGEEVVDKCGARYSPAPPAPSRSTVIMSTVLPGEHIPAQHVNLKLGPGLLHQSFFDGQAGVVATRAGDVQHSKNRSRWWIEGNSRRVSAKVSVFRHRPSYSLTTHKTVCACTAGVRCRSCHRPER